MARLSVFAKFDPALRFLANSRVFACLLLWLMAILVAGTVAEKTTGLYAAEKRYFVSYIIWLWDIVPVPGLLLVTVIIFFGLIARLALEYWQWKNLGTIVIHIGAALLLAGGFVTAHVSQEGAMVIPQGETRAYIEDLRHVEFAISELKHDRVVHETVTPEEQLMQSVTQHADVPFHITVVNFCRNCALQRLPQTVTEGNPHGVALNFVLQPIANDPNDDLNRAGLTFRITGTANNDGLYAIFQDMPIRQIIAVNDKHYWLDVRKARRALPFAIQLDRFTKDVYPGTDKPRGFQSNITLKDQGVVWPNVIRMNEPLRYKGYTFYQSSFLQGEGAATATVLSVVKNAGRLFPYLSGAMIACGFVIHLWQRLVKRKVTQPA